MLKRFLFALGLLIFCAPLYAADTTSTGSMFLGIGTVYNHYTTERGFTPFLDFGVQISETRFYSISTLGLGRLSATMRTGVGYSLKKSSDGNLNVIALMDGGITTASDTTALSVGGLTLGTVGGGVLLRYNLGAFSSRLNNVGIAFGLRETAVSGTSVTPEFSIKLSYFLK